MKKTIALLALAASLNVFACDEHGITGFAPENNLQISVGDKAANNMTEERFLAIIDKVETYYSPIVKEMGGTLKINKFWTNSTVNASAQRFGKTWAVNMYGGLARHNLATEDGFMLVICHELGHHMGGAPRYDRNTDWASNEGQADYWGNLKCMRRVLENDDNISIVASMEVDALATQKCKEIYSTDADVALCQRIAMAGKSLGGLLGSLSGNSDVNFDTPDMSIVSRINDNHPKGQCRLDTYFQGALCDKSAYDDVSRVDAKVGTCIQRDGYTNGVRPLCWYKPGIDEI